LKLRLWGARHGSLEEGVRIADVWEAWDGMRRPPGGPGWTAEEIAGIETYRGVEDRYHLPTLAELRALLAGDFEELEAATGGDEPAVHEPRRPLVRLAGREARADLVALAREAQPEAERVSRAAAEAGLVAAEELGVEVGHAARILRAASSTRRRAGCRPGRPG